MNEPLTCCACSKPMARGAKSLPQGEAMCRTCRRTRNTVRAHRCPDCGGTAWGTVCRDCRAKRQRIRPDGDHRVKYAERRREAPGLRSSERDALLVKWKTRRTKCTFCDQDADTIDHCIPLARGGTNYEGNLIPACRHCNSSKQARLITEWRYGRKAHRTISPTRLDKPNNLRIVAIRGEQPEFNVCPECGALCVNTYCDNTCCTRWNSRNRYRKQVGIPIDAPLYTRAA